MSVPPPTTDEHFPTSSSPSDAGMDRRDLAAHLMSSSDHPDSLDDCLDLVDADPEAAYADVQARWSGNGEKQEGSE